MDSIAVELVDQPVTVVAETPVVEITTEPQTVTVMVAPSPTVTVVTAVEQVVVTDGVRGQDGTNTQATFDKTAAVDLSGHRVVTPRSDGTVEYATNLEPADATAPIWLTLGAALAGEPVSVVAFGEVVEPSWNWTSGLPIFLGADGVLTQTPPTAPAVFILQLAASTGTPSSLFFDPKIPTEL